MENKIDLGHSDDEKFVRFILGWIIMLSILGSIAIVSWELASAFIELLW